MKEVTKDQFLAAAHEFTKTRTLRFHEIMCRYRVQDLDANAARDFVKTRVQENQRQFFELILRLHDDFLQTRQPQSPLRDAQRRFLELYVQVARAGKDVIDGAHVGPHRLFWERRGRRFGKLEPKQGNSKIQGRLPPLLAAWVDKKGGWSYVRSLIENDWQGQIGRLPFGPDFLAVPSEQIDSRS